MIPFVVILSARRGGFTLLELLVGMAVGAIVLAGLSLAMVSLQRSFEAANYQMTAQNDQLRVLDYISRDARMAVALAVDHGQKLSITLPVTDNNPLSVDLGTTLAGVLGLPPVVASQKVSYYVEGGQLIREFNGVQSVLADTVAEIDFDPPDTFLTTTVLFTPRFSNSPTTATQPITRVSNRTFLQNLGSGS